MPANSFTFVITTGLGVSVLAGILSGVCYVLKCRKKIWKKPITPFHCAVCNTQLTFWNTEIDKSILCAICELKSCKRKCSDYNDRYGWICHNCNSSKGLEFCKNINNVASENFNHKMNESKENKTKEKNIEQEKIKEFIESLVTTLLGGELGNVSTGRIYNDDQYHFIYRNYKEKISKAITNLGSALLLSVSNLPISGQSPCSAHESLKLLIQRFIGEAAKLPTLQNVDKHESDLHNQHETSYENLLSSAIINKVIQNYQNGSNSYPDSVSSTSNSSRKKNNRYFLGEKNLHSKYLQDESSSMSSLDDWIHTEKNSKTPQNHLKVQSRIDERVSSDDEEPDDSTKKANDWQENWFLQKRKFDGTNSPVPVPMLVPEPINEAKVLIGDKEVDDTSDLSDAFSDYEDYDYEAGGSAATSLNAVLLNSKSVIGGKNQAEKITAWSDDFIENKPILEQDTVDEPFQSYENETNVNETVNKTMLSNKDIEEESVLSYESNTEQDLEYTERYPTIPRKVMKTPQPLPRLLLNESSTGSTNIPSDGLKSENIDSGVTSDEDDKLRSKNPEFIGSYSEREKRKWNEAVEISNNPYSKSNLERRLSNRSSSSSLGSFFSRDYYIKESTRPAGSENYASSSEISSKILLVKDLVIFHEDKILDENVYRALPAIALDDEGHSKSDVSLVQSQLDSFTSDSEYSIERSYNLNSGEIMKKVGTNNCISPEDMENDLLIDNPENKLEDNKSIKYTKDETNGENVEENAKAITNYTPIPINQICHTRQCSEISLIENDFSLPYPEHNVEYSHEVNIYDSEKESKIDDNRDIVCVKELTQLFDNEQINNHQNQLHSLTARSIPIKMKDSLRDQLDKSYDDEHDGIKKNPEFLATVLPKFANTKSKIEFFENLKK